MKINKKFWIAIYLLAFVNVLLAQQKENIVTIPANGSIYINPNIGSDYNDGSREKPIKSLLEASKRVNNSNGKGSMTIYLSKGMYGLNQTVAFNPANWHFTKEERLTIRAEILPDSSDWNQGSMPVIVSTMPFDFKPYGNNDPLGGASYGIQIETSHVTIQGLRVLGSPVHEMPVKGNVIRNYPIVREGRSLEDLRVTQCLFIGNKQAIPNHLAILASGQGVVVDHCVFYGVKDAVVYWYSDRPAENCEMHHNLVLNNYGAAVWTWSVNDDFKFYNNVISGANVLWVLEKEAKNSYTIQNSMLVGYNELVNKGGGPQDFGIPADPKKLKYNSDFKIKKVGSLAIEEDQTSRYYLQLKPGTLGTSYGAGLFYKVK